MRKIRLNLQDLAVDTFEATLQREGAKGTVYGRISDYCASVNCTMPGGPTCAVEYCGVSETNDPRQRACVTPYVECGTDGWTCVYC